MAASTVGFIEPGLVDVGREIVVVGLGLIEGIERFWDATQ